VLAALAPDVWAARAPLRYLGMAIGTRMTVVRLPDGGLLLHSPVPMDDGLRRAVDALGPVRHLVCPNLFHHRFAGAAQAAYPDAVLHAPPRLAKKRPDLRIDHALSEAGHAGWGGALTPVHIDGTLLDETVLYHRASRTLVSSDLVEYFERCDDGLTRLYLRAAGVYQRATWNRLLRFVYRDRPAARRGIDRLLELDVERVVIAHGDVIDRDAHATLRDAFTWL
jgi:hypothetical protein